MIVILYVEGLVVESELYNILNKQTTKIMMKKTKNC
jgi:hypothetical protein